MTAPSRRVQRAAHRLADQQRNRLAELPSSRLLIATVATVTTGTASDGGAVVTVTYRGEAVQVAAYITPHVPIAGDRCVCALVDDQLIILGRLGGFPPEQ